MRLLILHCKAFSALEPKANTKQVLEDSIVALITVEDHDQDDDKIIARVAKEIEKAMRDKKQHNLVLFPFAHLSNKLANPVKARQILDKLKAKLEKYNPIETPFGLTKETMFHIHAYKGNVRYREF